MRLIVCERSLCRAKIYVTTGEHSVRRRRFKGPLSELEVVVMKATTKIIDLVALTIQIHA